jgi:hypothetical protein
MDRLLVFLVRSLAELLGFLLQGLFQLLNRQDTMVLYLGGHEEKSRH